MQTLRVDMLLMMLHWAADLCEQWAQPCRSWSRPGSSQCWYKRRSVRAERWGPQENILGHRTQMWSSCSQREAHHPVTDKSTSNMVWDNTNKTTNFNFTFCLAVITSLLFRCTGIIKYGKCSQSSYLIPQNVWVWFPFNHNSQTGSLPNMHIHILHDGFKLGRHYGRIRITHLCICVKHNGLHECNYYCLHAVNSLNKDKTPQMMLMFLYSKIIDPNHGEAEVTKKESLKLSLEFVILNSQSFTSKIAKAKHKLQAACRCWHLLLPVVSSKSSGFKLKS